MDPPAPQLTPSSARPPLGSLERLVDGGGGGGGGAAARCGQARLPADGAGVLRTGSHERLIDGPLTPQRCCRGEGGMAKVRVD